MADRGTCLITGCGRAAHCRRRCRRHYGRWLRERAGLAVNPELTTAQIQAVPSIGELHRRLVDRGTYEPANPLTGTQLLDRCWGREIAHV